MATTMVSIDEVITSKNDGTIILRGKDIDAALQGNLDTEFSDVSYSFSTEKRNEMSYIFRVASSRARGAKTFQEMLDKMPGQIFIINDSFRIK